MEEVLNRKLVGQATKDELIQWCIDRGIEVNQEDRVVDLRDKLKSKLGLHDQQKTVKGIRVFNGADEMDEDQEFKRVKVIIASEHDDKRPVYAAVNGRSFVIQRDLEAEIPYCVYRMLSQALTGNMDPESRKVSNAPLHSISLLG